MNTDDLNERDGFVVTINGAQVVLPEATLPTLRTALRAKGIVTFAAVVDGEEVSNPMTLVDAIAQNKSVEIRTYAKPGAAA